MIFRRVAHYDCIKDMGVNDATDSKAMALSGRRLHTSSRSSTFPEK